MPPLNLFVPSFSLPIVSSRITVPPCFTLGRRRDEKTEEEKDGSFFVHFKLLATMLDFKLEIFSLFDRFPFLRKQVVFNYTHAFGLYLLDNATLKTNLQNGYMVWCILLLFVGMSENALSHNLWFTIQRLNCKIASQNVGKAFCAPRVV